MIDEARTRANRPVRGGQLIPEVSVPPLAEPFDPELLDALAGLTADQREFVVLRFVADLSLGAVAELTGRKVGAVKALQHRGLANPAQAVSPEERTTL